MAIKQKRACSACHSAKVKCVRTEGSLKCKRCERLGLKCVEHVSRQGQGTRRRKKVKTKVMDENNLDEAFAITTALSPICTKTTDNVVKPLCPTSGNITEIGGQGPPRMCEAIVAPCQAITSGNNGEKKYEDGLCSGMDKLEVEDSLLCKSITNGMGRDHFGLNFLIREWVSLAFSRRSWNLLARASFIAAKMKIPMDDIISNQSPFAAETDSEPMEFLARDLLLPKGERKTLGYSIDLQEIPWDLLEAVQIDPKNPSESARNRWIGIRWTSNGICRFWTSNLFTRDFASVEEIGKVWEANSGDKEVIDLFLPKSEKGKFAQGIFNLMFVNHKPNMPCFVIKNNFKVQRRQNPVPVDVDVIQTMKVIDLDSMIHYFEIQFPTDPSNQYIMGDKTSSLNKREHIDTYYENVNDDPLMGDNGDNSIEFTDIEMTEEMEEFLKLINGE